MKEQRQHMNELDKHLYVSSLCFISRLSKVQVLTIIRKDTDSTFTLGRNLSAARVVNRTKNSTATLNVCTPYIETLSTLHNMPSGP